MVPAIKDVAGMRNAPNMVQRGTATASVLMPIASSHAQNISVPRVRNLVATFLNANAAGMRSSWARLTCRNVVNNDKNSESTKSNAKVDIDQGRNLALVACIQ